MLWAWRDFFGVTWKKEYIYIYTYKILKFNPQVREEGNIFGNSTGIMLRQENNIERDMSGGKEVRVRLISNAHSEISRQRDHVFKQTKVGSKVQYFSYKLTYLFFDIVALSFNTFFPT